MQMEMLNWAITAAFFIVGRNKSQWLLLPSNMISRDLVGALGSPAGWGTAGSCPCPSSSPRLGSTWWKVSLKKQGSFENTDLIHMSWVWETPPRTKKNSWTPELEWSQQKHFSVRIRKAKAYSDTDSHITAGQVCKQYMTFLCSLTWPVLILPHKVLRS